MNDFDDDDDDDYDDLDDEGGNEETSALTVKSYLVKVAGLPESKAQELIEKHAATIEHGRSLRSFAYYVANEILQAEGM